MKDVVKIIPLFLALITPDPQMKGVRLKKKQRRQALKDIRIAEKMLKAIKKEYGKDGFSPEELKSLDELQERINHRRMELI